MTEKTPTSKNPSRRRRAGWCTCVTDWQDVISLSDHVHPCGVETHHEHRIAYLRMCRSADPFLPSHMTTTQHATGKRTYRVYADYTTRRFQDVEAGGRREAYEAARHSPAAWQDCFEHEESDQYQISEDVQDVETGEFVSVGDPNRCRTCDSDIVVGVNGSTFREGECGPCEYQRYRTHRAFVEAASYAYGALRDLSYHPCFRWYRRRFREANEVIDKLATALNDYGREA